MAARFLVVPQWQGSGSSRAMRLADGANAIAGDLPASATTPVEVRIEAGESLGTGVNRYSSIQAVKRQVDAVLDTFGPDETVIVIGGDCGADLAGVERAVADIGPDDLALVWFDAHGDLNTPETSPSGTFSGMVLRTLLGDGAEGLVPSAPRLSPDHVVHAGARALDDAEVDYLASSGMRALAVDELGTPDALVEAVAATGATHIYLHVDLDVLDPAVIEGVGYPEPFGLSVDELTSAIRALRARFELAGAAVTGFAPASPEAAAGDLAPILRVLGALTRPAPGDAANASGAQQPSSAH
ncbi:arginase family protein [Gryllotalpicola ginsengisoli]|uniref:arginase family protein n=1 Tax=Gryllotalpicola ginsengisoli TaxID=444608 RepID=UPI0003B61873|nr:arginase family protein [Gryllotalpicola ginsengisoli]